jgi:hypothetical protein
MASVVRRSRALDVEEAARRPELLRTLPVVNARKEDRCSLS